MSMKIGLIGLSAKPYHIGHHCLVEAASKENDVVMVFVSTSDRKREGECPVFGTDMRKIWVNHLADIMPGNVQLEYGGNPIRKVYATLGDANEKKAEDTFKVYGDPDDLAKNFSEAALDKYVNWLWANGQLQLKAMSRSDTVNISGTEMREFISSGNKESFMKHLPRGVDHEAVWQILYNSYVENKPMPNTFTMIF